MLPHTLSPTSKRRAALMAQANRAHQARLRNMKRINRLLLEVQLTVFKNKIGLKHK